MKEVIHIYVLYYAVPIITLKVRVCTNNNNNNKIHCLLNGDVVDVDVVIVASAILLLLF